MNARRIVLATFNPDKRREMEDILRSAGTGAEVLGLDAFPGAPDVEEDGDTFEANAAKKARSAARATGLVSVADDSGLEVDALHGEPGVRSARYAGEPADHAANNRKLLDALAGVPDGERSARFQCTLAAASPGGKLRFFKGATEGCIAREPSGVRGFGYDPVFVSSDLGRTFAEVKESEKHAVSHRGRAMAQFAAALAEGEFDDWFSE